MNIYCLIELVKREFAYVMVYKNKMSTTAKNMNVIKLNKVPSLPSSRSLLILTP